jgi:hypothetical protein
MFLIFRTITKVKQFQKPKSSNCLGDFSGLPRHFQWLTMMEREVSLQNTKYRGNSEKHYTNTPRLSGIFLKI